jgi:hypothetical protein
MLAEWLIVLVAISYIFYLRNLQNIIKELGEENRSISHKSVYRCFIPYYNIYWQPKIIQNITNDIKKELEKRRLNYDSINKTNTIGLAYSYLLNGAFIISIIFRRSSYANIYLIAGILGIIGFVLWVIYWININKTYNFLRSNPFIKRLNINLEKEEL